MPTTSTWMADTPAEPSHPPLTGTTATADVAVVGAGIVGTTVAHLLAADGVDVALIEADRVGAGVSGHTTGKVSSLNGTLLSTIASAHGEGAARAYGEAAEAGLARIVALSDELGIDCDLRRHDNHTYATTEDGLATVRGEAELAQRLGLPATFTETLDLPYAVTGAVRFSDQAELHARRYVLGLASAAAAAGARIFERTRIISAGLRGPVRLQSADGAVLSAGHVVIATNMPILDRGLFFARTHAERSYVITARIRGALPGAMYLSADAPTRSIRTVTFGGEELLMVGGEGHRTGTGGHEPRYERLEAWTREHFEVAAVVHRFSSQDVMPVDHLPFAGPLAPWSPHLSTVTGLQKWGLAMGTTAAGLVCDQIAGRGNPWAAAFAPARMNPRASAAQFVQDNATVARRIVRDRFKRAPAKPEGLAPGEGCIVGDGRKQTALSRDREGVLHAVAARCTHLGCIVDWNQAEATWDCPCHGGRFAPDGTVLQGPPVQPLAPRPAAPS